MKAKVILTAVALFASLGMVMAQETKTNTSESKKSCYVDANNNNLCDKHEDKSCTTGEGKGLKDGSGNKDGKGKGTGPKDGTGKGHKNGDCNHDGACNHNQVKN
jgi:hypothetical protein